MKIISWNVNGIRAAIKKGFVDFLKKEKPDVLCLQEIKIDDAMRAKEVFDFAGYEEFWNGAKRPGYSGTAILVKSRKLKVESKKEDSSAWIPVGIGVEKFDVEGRVQTLDLGGCYLVNAYFPNSNHELSRLDYKVEFNKEILKHIKKLEAEKPVIVCGDFNVAHEEIDLARPKDNVGSPGFTDEERQGMDDFISAGYIDTFRHFYPDNIQYTWWSYRFRAREKNIGWRIDYFLVSYNIINKVKKAGIMDKVGGSDHCPVFIEIGF